MGTTTVPAHDGLEVELAALRARAYAADADIDADPQALGRLAELEAWHAAEARHSAAEPERPGASAERRAPRPSRGGRGEGTSREAALPAAARSRTRHERRRRLRWVAAAAVVALVLTTVAVVSLQPRPDVRLAATDERADAVILDLVDDARRMLIDKSTLQAYETFRGVEVWSAQSALANNCLLAVERATERLLAAACVPPGAAPTIEIYDVPVYWRDRWHDGLPTGTVVRFTLGTDSVSAWVYEGLGLQAG